MAFVDFLRGLLARIPEGEIHLILDNYIVHKSRYTKHTYITREINPHALDDLAWYTGEALSWDGQIDHRALDEWSDRVALEVLKQQGYRVAADADYDWVATVLGGEAETLFVDAAEAVRESVDYIKSDY